MRRVVSFLKLVKRLDRRGRIQRQLALRRWFWRMNSLVLNELSLVRSLLLHDGLLLSLKVLGAMDA